MLMTTLEEKERSGNFECLYPNPGTMAKYNHLFEYPRYNNTLIERFFADGSSWIKKN